MRQSSIVIHKGRKEEKYEIYIEDYVTSYLKEETGTLELSEFFFYGFREKGGKRYVVYGVGRRKDLEVFEKYDLLEEISCRLTQAGPVFLVRENDNIYEIKGYEVFYQDNQEMQSYLIEQKAGSADRGQKQARQRSVKKDVGQYAEQAHKNPYGAVSLQLCLVLVALVAIVINSTNSYDKMQQLNQSAEEVFFAMENQEADPDDGAADLQGEITIRREELDDSTTGANVDDKNTMEAANGSLGGHAAGVAQNEDILKLVRQENETKTGKQQETDGEESTNLQETDGQAVDEADQKALKDDNAKTAEQEDGSAKSSARDSGETEEGVEALSRNVTRYYEVERGDTLYTISKKIYGDISYVHKICELNSIHDPDSIRYGQKIILP